MKVPLSAGTFFAIMALISCVFAVYFYVNRSANRNLSPAESRDLNSDCVFMDFYDNHDLWHVFSSAGIFLFFLTLLTIDDDILSVPRHEIEVF